MYEENLITQYFYWKGFIHGMITILLIWGTIDLYKKHMKKNQKKSKISERKEPKL